MKVISYIQEEISGKKKLFCFLQVQTDNLKPYRHRDAWAQTSTLQILLLSV